jgi:hypothetical protein
MYEVLKKFVDDSANWFEAVGFLLAIFTAFKVFIIDQKVFDFNKKHLFQVRSADQILKLKEIARLITTNISDFSNKKIELREQLKNSEEIAKSIKKKVFKKDAENLQKIIKDANRIQNLPDNISTLPFFKRTYHKIMNTEQFSEDIVGQYYIKLSGLITYIEELKKDNENSLIP